MITLIKGEIKLERAVGTVVRGLRAPIINKGDDIEQIVVDTLLNASKIEGFSIEDGDIITITESVVARAQGNYATVNDIAIDINEKFGKEAVGVVFPILSRNRFSVCLRGIAKGTGTVVLMLSYPSDEVGNQLIDIDETSEGINPGTDANRNKFRNILVFKTSFYRCRYIGIIKN